MCQQLNTEKKVTTRQPVKILVVDDSLAILQVLIATLQPLQEDIDHTTSGMAAVQMCHDHEYAVILLDVNMPLMDGFEVASKIRNSKKSSKTPIIFVSGITENQANVLQAYALGAVDFIFKPVNEDILRSKVSVFVELCRMRLELAEARLAAEQKQLVMEDFIHRLRGGEIDRLEGNGENNKVIRLLDQTVLDENNRLVAELRQANEYLQQMNKDLNDFSQIASHDLREPLRTVINYCDLLKEDIKQQQVDCVLQDIDFIAKAARRMKTLVDDLLEFALSKGEFVNPNLVDLNKCLADVLLYNELFIEESQATIICPEPLPWVAGDESQLSRVFQNLINNSIKFRLPDSNPRVSIRSVPSPLGNGYCRLLFEDNGIGITEQFRDKIFEPFQRLNSKDSFPGSGIGLAIVKNIIKRHNGYIGLAPKTNSNTCFYVDLPMKC
jgi:signal transduction histidine kinase